MQSLLKAARAVDALNEWVGRWVYWLVLIMVLESAGNAIVRKLFEENPPYGAEVSFERQSMATGWNAPAISPWLEQSLTRASEATFGKPPAFMGEGGTIPFMAMLGEKFPKSQFVVTGVLGPHSNAHGPNEFLHIPTGQRVTAVVAQVLADHHARTHRM